MIVPSTFTHNSSTQSIDKPQNKGSSCKSLYFNAAYLKCEFTVARPCKDGRPDLECVALRDEDDARPFLARGVPRALERLGVVGHSVSDCSK